MPRDDERPLDPLEPGLRYSIKFLWDAELRLYIPKTSRDALTLARAEWPWPPIFTHPDNPRPGYKTVVELDVWLELRGHDVVLECPGPFIPPAERTVIKSRPVGRAARRR